MKDRKRWAYRIGFVIGQLIAAAIVSFIFVGLLFLALYPLIIRYGRFL